MTCRHLPCCTPQAGYFFLDLLNMDTHILYTPASPRAPSFYCACWLGHCAGPCLPQHCRPRLIALPDIPIPHSTATYLTCWNWEGTACPASACLLLPKPLLPTCPLPLPTTTTCHTFPYSTTTTSCATTYLWPWTCHSTPYPHLAHHLPTAHITIHAVLHTTHMPASV